MRARWRNVMRLPGLALNSRRVGRASDFQIRHEGDHLLDALVPSSQRSIRKWKSSGLSASENYRTEREHCQRRLRVGRAEQRTGWVVGYVQMRSRIARVAAAITASILVLSPEPAQSASSCRDQYNICRVRCPTMNSGCPLRCQTRLKRCKVPTPDLANLLPYSRSNLQR